jgi:aminoglycoside phosphotransferase (APT) family kinase protein
MLNMNDEILSGGIANAGLVVRRGSEVLRPVQPNEARLSKFLHDLRSVGFNEAPLPLGITDDGRARFEFIVGDVVEPPFPDWVQTDAALASVARLLRRFHDAAQLCDATGNWSNELSDPAGARIRLAGSNKHPDGTRSEAEMGPVSDDAGGSESIVCHNDVCLENVVFVDGVAVGLLDFDFAAPGRRLFDFAQFVRMCAPMDADPNTARLGWTVADRAERLRIAADAYGLTVDERNELPAMLEVSMTRGEDFVERKLRSGDPNFVKMYALMGGAERVVQRRRWFEQQQERFNEALR